MMSVQATPFGNITFPENLSKKRRAAILRALGWCEQICTESGAWTAQSSTHGQRLVKSSTGMNWPFLWSRQSWMPVERWVADLKTGICRLSQRGRVCVAPVKGRLKDLHTDMVACLLLLCETKEVEPQHLRAPMWRFSRTLLSKRAYPLR